MALSSSSAHTTDLFFRFWNPVSTQFVTFAVPTKTDVGEWRHFDSSAALNISAAICHLHILQEQRFLHLCISNDGKTNEEAQENLERTGRARQDFS